MLSASTTISSPNAKAAKFVVSKSPCCLPATALSYSSGNLDSSSALSLTTVALGFSWSLLRALFTIALTLSIGTGFLIIEPSSLKKVVSSGSSSTSANKSSISFSSKTFLVKNA